MRFFLNLKHDNIKTIIKWVNIVGGEVYPSDESFFSSHHQSFKLLFYCWCLLVFHLMSPWQAEQSRAETINWTYLNLTVNKLAVTYSLAYRREVSDVRPGDRPVERHQSKTPHLIEINPIEINCVNLAEKKVTECRLTYSNLHSWLSFIPIIIREEHCKIEIVLVLGSLMPVLGMKIKQWESSFFSKTNLLIITSILIGSSQRDLLIDMVFNSLSLKVT